MSRYRRSIQLALSSALALALLVAPLVLAPASATAAEKTFTFSGRGYGHGIGMSQYGARGYARKGFKGEDIVPRYFPGTTVSTMWTRGSSAEPTVKVALQAKDTPDDYWTVRSNSGPLWIGYQGGSSYVQLKQGVYYTICVPYDPAHPTDSRIRVRHVEGGAAVVDHTFPATTGWVQVFERDKTQPRWVGKVQVNSASGPWSRPDVVYRGSLVFNRSSSNAFLLHLRNYLY
ncbi:MAG: hypothetical protein Q8K89_06420, partial [Actinomycetota bacterium]|nr:hypothetical protein [Actinomycetota bacterium]